MSCRTLPRIRPWQFTATRRAQAEGGVRTSIAIRRILTRATVYPMFAAQPVETLGMSQEQKNVVQSFGGGRFPNVSQLPIWRLRERRQLCSTGINLQWRRYYLSP